MSEGVFALLDRLLRIPEAVLYVVLGLTAALENVLPPIPADVVVVFGGMIAGRGGADVFLVFLAVWLCNVGGALLVYGVGRRHGIAFFDSRWGRRLLRPRQVELLNAFYRRFGFGVIFISRFLPMFRAVVPVFAGVARLGLVRTAVPMALASAAWYGALVYLGSVAGRNLGAILARLQETGRWLWVAAALVAVAVAVAWWRTRSAGEER